MSLQAVRARAGKFEKAHVYEFDVKGTLISRRTVNVGPNASVDLEATGGNLYLVYADLGDRYANTYRMMCHLNGLIGRGSLVDDICTEILCGNQSFPASDLGRRYPELGRGGNMPDFGGGLIGGFGGGGGGGVCGKCLDTGGGGQFVPVTGCESNLPADPPTPPPGEMIVFQHIPFTSDTASGNSQIFKMGADGSNPVNISNNRREELQPDVSEATQLIVFRRLGVGLHTMNTDGGDVTAINNSGDALFPKWSDSGSERHFILFHIPGSGGNSAPFSRIFPDGSSRRQVLPPRPNEETMGADVLEGGRHIVFARIDETSTLNGGFHQADLFLKNIRDDTPEVRLTNTLDIIETLPAVSHDGTMIAFRARILRDAAGQPVSHDEIHVARIDADRGTLTTLHAIPLSQRIDSVTGITFSRDDRRLFFSALVIDIDTTTDDRRSEIFSVSFDGATLRRLTDNTDFDGFPSAIPLPRRR
ncbi:MAG TPA: hypothetical protein VFX96_06235 [Pyrinomonadaceae bacterium]|nr:hypothetical protein [Pyrinomonadaceae bacterium]